MEHYSLAKGLCKLRDRGVLIVGIGNLVHNLQHIAWHRMNENFYFDWTEEASSAMKEFILDGDHQQLAGYSRLGKSCQMSSPPLNISSPCSTDSHYRIKKIQLLYSTINQLAER